MPKRATGRPAKGKARTRRPQPRPSGASTGAQPAGAQPVEAATPTFPASAPTSASPSVTARRGAVRRAPAIAINYSYLRHDLNLLAVLAPTMVVLLIISYFVFHTT